MKRLANAVLLSTMILALGTVGCHFQKAPKGFPKTVPFQVVVTCESKPVADASVILTPKEVKNSWTITGRTDSSGVAAMQTVQGTYTRKGVPVGSYHVTLSKDMDVSGMVTVVNDGSIGAAAAYAAEVKKLREENPSEVPHFMNEAETSPITTEVAKGTKEFKIEITSFSEEE